jgi:hypothetical protein
MEEGQECLSHQKQAYNEMPQASGPSGGSREHMLNPNRVRWCQERSICLFPVKRNTRIWGVTPWDEVCLPPTPGYRPAVSGTAQGWAHEGQDTKGQDRPAQSLAQKILQKCLLPLLYHTGRLQNGIFDLSPVLPWKHSLGSNPACYNIKRWVLSLLTSLAWILLNKPGKEFPHISWAVREAFMVQALPLVDTQLHDRAS